MKAPVLAAVSEEAGQVDGDVVVVVVGGGVVAQVAQDHHVLAQGEHCHTTNITIKIKIDFENHVVCLPYKPNPHPLVFTSFKFNSSVTRDSRL